MCPLMKCIQGSKKGPERSYVVHGAIIKCSQGSKHSLLGVPNSHGVYLRGAAQLTIHDYKPYSNIQPFETCKQCQATCVPNTAPWIEGKDDVLIEGVPALLNTSTTTCLVGGIISILNDGQEAAAQKE